MYDIISAEGVSPEAFSFSKFFLLKDVKGKIASAHGMEEAVKLKNRKTLVALEEYKEDIGLMRLFAGGHAAFLVNLGRITGTRGPQRAVEIAKMRRFLRVCVKYKVPFALASFAKDEFSVRTSRELCHIASLVGLNAGQAQFALERLAEYLG